MKVELDLGRRVSWTLSNSHEGLLDAGPLYISLIAHGLAPCGFEFFHINGCVLHESQLPFELDRRSKLMIISVGEILI